MDPDVETWTPWALCPTQAVRARALRVQPSLISRYFAKGGEARQLQPQSRLAAPCAVSGP